MKVFQGGAPLDGMLINENKTGLLIVRRSSTYLVRIVFKLLGGRNGISGQNSRYLTWAHLINLNWRCSSLDRDKLKVFKEFQGLFLHLNNDHYTLLRTRLFPGKTWLNWSLNPWCGSTTVKLAQFLKCH